MMLVLDRSGSMQTDGGGSALKAAVPQFLQNFIQGTDYIGMISFASHSNLDTAISNNHWGPYDTGPLNTAVQAFNFTGATFGGGAGSGTVYSTTNGPPLNMADAQTTSVNLGNSPETKVVIYFTDGLMNTLQDQMNCPGATLMNYGGADPNSPGEGPPYNPDWVFSLSPTAELTTYYCYAADGANGCNSSKLPTYDGSGTCTYNGSAAKFPSEEYPAMSPLALTRWNVTNEAKYRAKYTANVMRGESPLPTYIYIIGLGTAVSGDPCTQAFLGTLANDPDYLNFYGGVNCDSGNGTYNANQPQGLFVIVPDCPGTQCTQELQHAFQTIAERVLLRLSL